MSSIDRFALFLAVMFFLPVVSLFFSMVKQKQTQKKWQRLRTLAAMHPAQMSSQV